MSETTGASNGGAPATTVTPPLSTTAAPGATVPAPTPVAPDWKGALSDDLRSYAEGKGFKDPGTVLDGYRNLEKLRGVPSERLVTVPDRHDDTEGWNGVYNRLGRPEKPEGYNIPVPDKTQEQYVGEVQKIFHESGLTIRQAEILNSKMNNYTTELKTAAETARQTTFKSEETALKTEWGAAFDQNMNVSRQAAKTFGLTTEKIDAIEKAMGFSATIKLFQQIGSKLGESDFVTGNGPSGRGALTPDQAKAQIKVKTEDKNFWNRYLEGEGSAREEMEALHKWANPEPA